MGPVLLAHLTHVVSVAEDEVLFFLKRGRRTLGGAWQRKQKKASLNLAYAWNLLRQALVWVCVERHSSVGHMHMCGRRPAGNQGHIPSIPW